MNPDTGKLLQHEDLFHLCEATDYLSFSYWITAERKILTVYPYSDSGIDWPLEIKEIHLWPNKIEAQLLCSCNGARIGIYDTLYYRKRDVYRTDQIYQFIISGLVYKIFKKELPADCSEDFTCYLPISKEDEGGIDEIQFSSYIEDIEEIEAMGLPFYVFTMTLAVVNEFPMKVRMYCPKYINQTPLKEGDRISGYAWIFGYTI